MSAGKYRWVQTDQRTDAEILREIAGSDSPLVIVSREYPMKLADAIRSHFMNLKLDLLMVEFPTKNPGSAWHRLRGGLSGLNLLVTEPAHFGALAIIGPRPIRVAAEMSSATLWEFLLQCGVRGLAMIRLPIEAARHALAPLGEATRRRLVPAKPVHFSELFRRQIHDLAGLEFLNSFGATALRAGLFQWHDALEESHACAQSIENQGVNQNGDYWHAIMHRREPDYGNSKYWFRQLGPQHPVFPELGRQAEPLIAAAAPEWKDRLLRGGWDPFAFVDLCEAAADGKHSEWESLAESIQELEMLLLLASTYRDATA